MILSENTLFLEEGRNVLIEEFGKDYGNYFSFLMLIASSKTSRSEMESIMNISIGGFLEKLENEFGLIAKVRPILSKPAGKNVKYRINDNFLNFWFRFIYKCRSAVEMGNYDYAYSFDIRPGFRATSDQGFSSHPTADSHRIRPRNLTTSDRGFSSHPARDSRNIRPGKPA